MELIDISAEKRKAYGHNAYYDFVCDRLGQKNQKYLQSVWGLNEGQKDAKIHNLLLAELIDQVQATNLHLIGLVSKLGAMHTRIDQLESMLNERIPETKSQVPGNQGKA